MDLARCRFTPTQKAFLESRKIESLEQLLYTYPLRYVPITSPDKWKPGEEVLFEGVVAAPSVSHPISKGRILCRLKVLSWNREMDVSVFAYGHYPSFPAGKRVTVCGIFQGGSRIDARWTSFQPLPDGSSLYPVYSLPLKTRRDTMLKIMAKALPYRQQIAQRVPLPLQEKYHLMPSNEALLQAHQPTDLESLSAAVRSLKYEEFLCFHCARLLQSARIEKTPRLFDQARVDELIAVLPYPLTADQKSAAEDILNDIRSDHAMYRLVQGDVGCGKTVVGALAIAAMEAAGFQSALLAPTEILARQHVESLKKAGVKAALFCSALKASEKKKVLGGLKTGTIRTVVGTHSLFSQGVEFARLGLVIADEQQRFGVLQRRALIEKSTRPDVLLMSATPIPRTAAHFLYGDIDLSSIRTMPPGRSKVLTRVFHSASMKPVLPRILEGVEQEGRQVYVICPAVEENEEENFHSAQQIYEGMRSVLKDRVSIGLLHGKMKTARKQAVMDEFAAGKIQVLVSTTVIEVGIDVSNATMMVIYDAHRFGLSTLHQLRGRCARGSKQGECYLLSSSKDPKARERLKIMENVDNGFDLSRYDLALRGPGDLLGTRQSGLPAFILGDAGKDLAMMDACARDAREIVEHPEKPENRAMMHSIVQAVDHSRFLD